jgi:hypothetical protein
MTINEQDMPSPASTTATLASPTTPLSDATATEEESHKAPSEHSEGKEANVPDKENLEKAEEVPDEEVPDEEAPNEETPDEEPPDESEEYVTATYNIENTPGKGSAYAAVGNYAQLHHHHVTNRYDHLKIILESKQSVHDELADGFRSIGDLMQQALAQVQQSKIVPQPKDEEENTPLPDTHHALSKWFYDLDEYEQCYVQAVAILHGSAASDISQYADEFYLLHRQQQQASNPAPQTLLSEELQASLLSLHNRSRRGLQAKTFTTTQRVDGIERLYWRDVEADGSSSFHLQVLDFLAGEYQSKGRHGKDALEKLGTWAQINNAERFQCIARALGVFLWHQNKNALWQRANEWAAQRPSVMRWQRTAILLNAAHECDLLMYPEHAYNQGTSPTLQILVKWEVCAQKMASKADVYRGCAAANTYALIGKRQPDIALAGLAQLLLLEAENLVEIDKLQAAVVSAYFTLSRSGHTYQTLCHLGTTAEQALLQPARPATARSRRIYRLQCQLLLKASLDAFFFIALDSSSNATLQYAANYQHSGASSPSSQEEQQYDRILAGILMTDTTSPFCWRQEVVQILSIAIIERSSHASAFGLLFRWAYALSEMKDISSVQGKQLIASFQAFLVDLGHTLKRKSLNLQQQKRLSPAFQLYTKQLALWSQQKNTTARLFRQPAYRLNSIHQPTHA